VEAFARLREAIGARGTGPQAGEDVPVPVTAERETGP